jgi:hypothetical protein
MTKIMETPIFCAYSGASINRPFDEPEPHFSIHLSESSDRSCFVLTGSFLILDPIITVAFVILPQVFHVIWIVQASLFT